MFELFMYYWIATLFFGVYLYAPTHGFVTALLAPLYPFITIWVWLDARKKRRVDKLDIEFTLDDEEEVYDDRYH